MLNLPGHVLIQIREKSPVVIDPFAGGGLVSQRTVAAICRTCLGEKGDASAFSVVRMNNRDLLARLLNNQAIRAENNNDLKGLPRSRRVRLMSGKRLRVCSWHSTMFQVQRQAC